MTHDDELTVTPDIPFQRIQSLALLIITALFSYLVLKILSPFISPLIWAAALSIIAEPAYRRLRGIVPSPGIRAGLVTITLTIAILVPFAWVARELLETGLGGITSLFSTTMGDWWREFLKHYPLIQQPLESLDRSLNLSAQIHQTLSSLTQHATHIIALSAWETAKGLITIFAVFFFLRDGPQVIETLQGLTPLSAEDTNRVLGRVRDTIHATVFGTIIVAALQGFLGGLLLWWLEISGPAIWGVIMGLLALIPYLGAFVVWIPLALSLFISGEWVSALATALWGSIIIGLSDNLLYPILVGKRLRYHPLLVFFFLVGGVSVFGAAGIILGPSVLAIVDGLLLSWKARTTPH